MAITTTDQRLQRIEDLVRTVNRNVLNLSRWSIDIMTQLQDLEAKVDLLTAAAADAKADSAAQRALGVQVVGQLQDMNQAIVDLRAQVAAGQAVTPEDLDRLSGKVQGSLDLFATANAERDQAQADLAAGASANTGG
jgi:multidrug resistance efflux pump